MEKPRAVKGEWVWQFNVGPDWRYAGRGWRVFSLAAGKMRRDLPQGVNLRQRDLWGIRIVFCFWLPFERFS